MKKKKTKFFASPFIMFGLIFMLLLMLSIWIFTLFFPFADGRVIDDLSEFIAGMGVFLTIIFVFATVFCPVMGFILACHKGFSVFEISEKGVKSSLFKIFRNTEITWDDMTEIRCYGMVTRWLFFSKICLENMSYNDIIKRKDVLQIEYSKQVIEMIRLYSDKEIINLSEKLHGKK